jgi:outer membrane usher protein
MVWPGAVSAATDASRPLQLEISINGEKTGLLGSFLQLPDGRIAARRSELVEIGVKVPGPGDPDEVVTLDELVGGKFKYDEPTQSISFELTNEQRIARAFDALGTSARLPVRTGWGSTLNYSLFGSGTSGLSNREAAFNGGSASLDARAFSPYGTFSQTGILGTTTTRDLTALRLDTAFTYSDTESLITYRAGDSISGGLNWTRPIRFGGIQVQRNFGIRSDLVTAPLPSFSGSAAVPSTLDVFVNNSKTYTQEVPSGPFQINNLPLVSGGEARLVLRDATGREVETSMPFYTSPQLLRQGLSYFSMETGVPRLQYGTESDNYVEKAFAAASVRHGLSDWLTLEGHAEMRLDIYNGGAGLVARTGDFGVLSAAASGSSYQGQNGMQGYAAFETKLWGITLNVSSIRTFGNYNDLASVTVPVATTLSGIGASGTGVPLTTTAAPAKAIDRATAGFRLPDSSSLGLSFIHLEPAYGKTTNLVSASWSRPVFNSASVFVTAFADVTGDRNYGIFAGISFPFGDNGSISTGATNSPSGTSYTTDASRPLAQQSGSYGWRVRDSEGAVPDRYASASYRSTYGVAQAGVEQTQGNVRGTVQVDGAIATLGTKAFFANKIDDSFAVVDTGTPGVPVYYENRPIGETDSRGQLLVPNLRAYGSNKISIDPKGLPVNDVIETTEDVVAPADRSGVLVKFDTKTNTQAAVVIFVDPAGKPLQVGSKGQLDEASNHFVVGYDGRAFVTDLKAANNVTVTLEKGGCHAAFEFAAAADRQVVVGPVTCQ